MANQPDTLQKIKFLAGERRESHSKRLFRISFYPSKIDLATIINITWLVVSTPLKNMKISWDDCSQYMENKKCSKTPTSNISDLFLKISWEVLPSGN